MFRENGKFVTSVYRKPTFSGVFSHFDSLIPKTYKFGLVSTLIFRCFSICSDMTKFHEEVCKLKTLFKKNGYKENFFDKCLKKFLDKIYTKKISVYNVPKKDICIVLPFLGKLSLTVRTNLQKTVKELLPYCKLKVVFQIPTKLQSKFNFKDRINKEIRSLLVYKFECSSCKTTYIGKTKRDFKVRVSDHMGVSPLTLVQSGIICLNATVKCLLMIFKF